jgi:tetratricopeptide (TPR) repeat protein
MEHETATVTLTETTPPSLRQLAVGTQVGRYRIIEVLGVGGMAVVYRAHDPYLSRDVALKLVHEYRRLLPQASNDHSRLLREAQALAKLSHPNVVAAFDVGAHDGAVFLAMELVEGESLRDWLRTERPVDEIVPVLMGAARGLAAAHDAGVLHRDFKPSNVVVSPDQQAHVVDFGLARDGAEDEAALAGAVMGTPGFMAPEQAAGGDVDARADQFGFAASMFFALTGQCPYAGRTIDEYRRSLRGAPAAWTSGIDRRLQRIIDRALALRPEDRWPSMTAMVAELDRARAPRRGRTLAIAVAATVVLGVLGMFALRTARAGSACAVDASAFDGSWDATRRAAVLAAFSAQHSKLADDSFTLVARRLDDVRDRWMVSRRAACEATHVRGEQTERVQALRDSCLDDKRAQVKTMVDSLAAANPAMVERSIAAVMAIGEVGECDDVAMLLDESDALPAEPASQRALEQAARSIEEAEALWRTGRYEVAKASLQAQLPEIVKLGHQPTEARARVELAQVLLGEGSAEQALAELERALRLAARAPRLRAEISLSELTLMVRERRMPQAEAILPHVDASIEAIGRPARLQLLLLIQRGAARAFAHDYAAARESLGAAQMLCAGISEVAPAVKGSCLAVEQELGILALEEGDPGTAARTFAANLASMKVIYGPRHPSLVATYMNLVGALSEQGDRAGALAAIAEARTVVADLSPKLPHHARLDLLEGTVWQEGGDCVRAIPLYRRAIERFVTDVRNRTLTRLRLGRCLVATDDPKAAVGELEIVVEQRKAEGAPLEWQGEVTFDLARALWATPATRVRARAVALDSAEMYRAAGEDGAEQLAEVQAWLNHPE